MESAPLCALSGVEYAYSRSPESEGVERPALYGINLAVYEGEWIALMGMNGSGKSTLVKMMNALLVPTQGACCVLGMDTRDPQNALAIRASVAMVFQNPEEQSVASMVEEDVAFGPENTSVPTEEIRRRVEWALDVVGLHDRRGSLVHALSGGQKQRLAIAGALAMKPRCLILDEATSMLDPEGRAEIMMLLRELHASGMAIVQITHAAEETVYADRVLFLREGAIAWEGSPADFLNRLESWGFEKPPLVRVHERLLAARKIPRGTRCDVDGIVEALCPSV